MVGQVAASKPNTRKAQVQKDINARIRRVIDMRPVWSAMIKRTVLNVPQAYTTGGVSFTSGSKVVTGTATAWPVSDKVNTTMTVGVRDVGFAEITPADMTNIGVDQYLYISDSGYSEVVCVVEVTATTFIASFQYQHNDGTAITASSLAGLQFKLGPYNPVYTFTGVATATSGYIDTEFGGGGISNAGYSLAKVYFTIDPCLKDIFSVWDPIQGEPLDFHKPQAFLQNADPQRTATGYPQVLVDYLPMPSGSMQYELWPHQLTPYQIPVIYFQQWPELKRPLDRPPYFVDPTIFIDGAIADALRRKDLRSVDDKDPYFNPALAGDYERKFAQGVVLAAAADEGKVIQALEGDWSGYAGPNAAWRQSHVSMDMDW
jgi:hypothetical protein